MTVTVALTEVVDAMEMGTEEWSAHLNKKTGELVTISEEDQWALEHDSPDDLADWQKELLPKMREATESKDYLTLPSKFDIHEWTIMEDFSRSRRDEIERNELLNAIRGSGAFRYFRDTIDRLNLRDAWYDYRQQALEKIAIDWLQAHGIHYKK